MGQRLLLTPAEAAEAIGVSRSKLYELLGAGQIQSVYVGRSRRIPVTALEEFVAQLAGETADHGPGTRYA
jgi:excisionase family DNA binding protein